MTKSMNCSIRLLRLNNFELSQTKIDFCLYCHRQLLLPNIVFQDCFNAVENRLLKFSFELTSMQNVLALYANIKDAFYSVLFHFL